MFHFANGTHVHFFMLFLIKFCKHYKFTWNYGWNGLSCHMDTGFIWVEILHNFQEIIVADFWCYGIKVLQLSIVYWNLNNLFLWTIPYIGLINDWSAILLCLPCILFHEYMCGFFLFTEFWCFAFGFLLWDLAKLQNLAVT